MAYKRKYKKKTKKTGKKNYKKSIVSHRVMGSLGNGFPNKLQFTHKYSDDIQITSTSGVMANYRFRTNGIADLNQTGGGHQPSYFDVINGIYDHWVVIGSRLEVTFIPNSLLNAAAAFGIAINDDNSTLATDFVHYSENSNCKVKYLSFDANEPKKLTMNWSAKKAFGGSIMNNSNLQGSNTTDPAEQQIFNVFLQAVDQTSTVSLRMVARMTLIVVWSELTDMVQS